MLQQTVSTNGRRLHLRWRSVVEPFDFRELPLSDPTLAGGGVYIISRVLDNAAVRIGQASRLRDRLRAHQCDPSVVGSTREPLSVAWAWVPRVHRDGVEAFLARTLRPSVGERFPSGQSIEVDLPLSNT